MLSLRLITALVAASPTYTAVASLTPIWPRDSNSSSDVSLCQSSQVSWSNAYTSTFQPQVVTSTYTYTYTSTILTVNVSYGQADIYTTISGIPHAHGQLNVTSVAQYTAPYEETTVLSFTTTVTQNVSFPNPSPTCTIGTAVCFGLWESYFSSLGLPTTNLANATEPAITPVPSNRPRCSIAPVSPYCEPLPTPSCVLSADRVQMYYWPEITPPPSNSKTEPVTAVINNMTFTSPSVYLQFNSLQALTSSNLDETCTVITPLGATGTFGFLGGGAISPIGGPMTNAIVSLLPTSLSSLVRDLGPGINTASAVSEIAHGGSNYSYWINNVAGTRFDYFADSPSSVAIFGGAFFTSVIAQPVDYRNFRVPDPTAYYMNINTAAGCNRVGPHPECSTIFDGAYRAQLLIPDQVRSLRPEWASCSDPLYGAYDPPMALTAVNSVAGVTEPGGGSFVTSSTPSVPVRTSHVIVGPTKHNPQGVTQTSTSTLSSPITPGQSANNGGANRSGDGDGPDNGGNANQGSIPNGSTGLDGSEGSTSVPAPNGSQPDLGSGEGGEVVQTTTAILGVSEPAAGVFDIGSSTVRAGGPDIIVDGQTISAATDGLVIDGGTTAILSAGYATSLTVILTATGSKIPSSSNSGSSEQINKGLSSASATVAISTSNNAHHFSASLWLAFPATCIISIFLL